MNFDPDPESEQGFVAQGCGYCQILHPGMSDCPRCGGETIFRQARMMDAGLIRRAVFEAAEAYAPERECLDRLVDLLFIYGPVALDALRSHGRLTLEILQRDDQALGAGGGHPSDSAPGAS